MFSELSHARDEMLSGRVDKISLRWSSPVFVRALTVLYFCLILKNKARNERLSRPFCGPNASQEPGQRVIAYSLFLPTSKKPMQLAQNFYWSETFAKAKK